MEGNLEHPWEYTHLVQYVTPKTKPDYSTKEGLKGLSKACGQILTKIPQIIDKVSIGSGWQVNSHSIFLVNGSVMISILLQRPKRL